MAVLRRVLLLAIRCSDSSTEASPVSRLTGAVVALLCLLSSATASLDRTKTIDRSAETRLAARKGLPPSTTEVPPPAEAQLTDETEVFLDGRKCQYKDVPASAAIPRLVPAP